MIQKNWGRIVNISSRAALEMRDRSVYAAAKAGLIEFTRSWALELAKSGITVNAIAPGPIETQLFRQKTPQGSIEEQNVLRSIPIGRVGRPEEVAAAVAFFLSEAASFITGQNRANFVC